MTFSANETHPLAGSGKDQDGNLGLESIDVDALSHRHALLLVAGAGAREESWAYGAALALARGLAEQGRRVVLADLDFGEPALHAQLGESNAEGVSDVFSFGASLEHVALAASDRPFALIPAGVGVTDARVVLEHAGWARILARFEADREPVGDLLLAFVPAGAPGLAALAHRIGAAVALGLDDAECAAIETALPDDVQVLAELAPVAFTAAAPAPPGPPAASPASPAEIEVGGGTVALGPVDGGPSPQAPPIGAGRPGGGDSLPRHPEPDRATSSMDSEPATALHGEPLHGGPEPSGARTRELESSLDETIRRRRARNLAVFAVLVVAATASILYFGARLVPGSDRAIQTPAAMAETPPAGTPPTPAGRAAGEELPYAFAVEMHQELAEASRRMQSLEREAPTIGFFIAPLVVGDAVAYRVLAGPVRDSAAAAELMDWLVDNGHAMGRSEWSIRAMPYAFLLGEYDGRDQADQRRDELAARDIPSYVLEMPYTGATPSTYVLYAGAYSGAAEAELMRQLLLAEGLSDSLVERKGRLPQ